MANKRRFIEIKPEHVGQPIFKAFGKLWHCAHFIGQIFSEDVGKRVYLVNGRLRAETDQEMKVRLNKGLHTL